MDGLVHDLDFDPRWGEAVELRPGLRRLTARNPGLLTFRGTNSYLVGVRRLVVVDPGPADSAHHAALRAAVGGASVEAVLLTHTHRDHSDGARAFARAVGAPIAAAGAHRFARPPRPGEEDPSVHADLDLVPDRLLADGERIGGDWELVAVATPGHAENHLAFALAGGEELLSGDHVMAWSTTVVAPPDGSMARYRASLARLAARGEDRYWPGHGGPVAEGRRYVEALARHRLHREEAILARVAAGDATPEAIAGAVYTGLDPRLLPAAALSVLAHLEDLAERGEVELAASPVGVRVARAAAGERRGRSAAPFTHS